MMNSTPDRRHTPKLKSGLCRAAVLAAILLLPACAGMQKPAAPGTAEISASETARPEALKSAAPGSEASGSFAPSTLYALLVAEMAAQRGMPQVALHHYLREAEATGDPGIARQAVQLANQARDREALLRAVQLWQRAEPDNPAPYRVAAIQLMQQNRYDEALSPLERALRLNDTATLDALAERAGKLPPDVLRSYLDLTRRVLHERPHDPLLLYLQAVLQRAAGKPDAALDSTRAALDQDPASARALMLEAELQAKAGHLDTAINHLREALQEQDHTRMRTLYARLLLKAGKYPQAEEQIARLMKANSNDHNLAFYLALMLLENDRPETAERYFSELEARLGENPAVAFYRARIAASKGDLERAVDFYRRADRPPYLLPAQAELVRLLDSPDAHDQVRAMLAAARERQPEESAAYYALEGSWLAEHGFADEALALYNEALKTYPDDSRLLYNRAMLLEQKGDLAGMERDLRRLIGREPDNANALNALGYSLTVHTDRHREAHELISKALALRPDDPAILDSMGWVLFNLGRTEEALPYLEDAWRRFPDPEIAAHLGRAYWRLGRHEDARRVWNRALEQNPDSPFVRAAMTAAEQEQPRR